MRPVLWSRPYYTPATPLVWGNEGRDNSYPMTRVLPATAISISKWLTILLQMRRNPNRGSETAKSISFDSPPQSHLSLPVFFSMPFVCKYLALVDRSYQSEDNQLCTHGMVFIPLGPSVYRNARHCAILTPFKLISWLMNRNLLEKFLIDLYQQVPRFIIKPHQC